MRTRLIRWLITAVYYLADGEHKNLIKKLCYLIWQLPEEHRSGPVTYEWNYTIEVWPTRYDIYINRGTKEERWTKKNVIVVAMRTIKRFVASAIKTIQRYL